MNTDNIEVTQQEEEAFNSMSEQVEWNNGDACKFDERTGFFIGLSKNKRLAIVEIENNALEYYVDIVRVCDLSKPETEAEKLKRERLESAYDLFSIFKKINGVMEFVGFDKWKETQPIDSWLAIVDKTNYRKGVK